MTMTDPGRIRRALQLDVTPLADGGCPLGDWTVRPDARLHLSRSDLPQGDAQARDPGTDVAERGTSR